VAVTKYRDQLVARIADSGIPIQPDAISQLEAFLLLLTKWNARINLTALPLDPPTDESLDRLFVEPLAAARRFPDRPEIWLDLGSGGGSPAIPLKIMRPRLRLTMVESKARKAAFLNEVVRTLGLSTADVENARFEDLPVDMHESARFVTVRAVRTDAALSETAARLLTPDGKLMLFRPEEAAVNIPGFAQADLVQLGKSGKAYLATYQRVFHVEQSS
jgi:16S rRNA (guanine527-N7)-methyltransferase